MPDPRPLLRPVLPLLLCLLAWPAQAQLAGLPGGGLPTALPQVRDTVQRLPRTVRDTLQTVPVRTPTVEQLLRRHPARVELDPAGAPVVRSEVVAIDPAAAALELARDAGFDVGRTRSLEPLGLRLVVLRAPDGLGTAAALEQLRRLDPAGTYDFNHLYFGSGAVGTGAGAEAGADVAATGDGVRVGLVDSGVDADHPAMAGVDVRHWGCDGRVVPDGHGTAVASLLVGGEDGGDGGTLFAADIYCGQPAGGAANGFAEAMAWLAQQDVGVINLSLVGPHNALLQRATAALAARGHVLVAAVGNDGPASPPLFPAAYPDVIGVTAVDPRGRALPEAVRGAQVDFAARGSQVRAARSGGGWTTVRGTSFAAPLVARAAAHGLGRRDEAAARKVRERLAATARDLGEDGRDDTYGFGLVEARPAVAVGGSR